MERKASPKPSWAQGLVLLGVTSGLSHNNAKQTIEAAAAQCSAKPIEISLKLPALTNADLVKMMEEVEKLIARGLGPFSELCDEVPGTLSTKLYEELDKAVKNARPFGKISQS